MSHAATLSTSATPPAGVRPVTGEATPFLVTVAAVLLIFGLLYNRWWVPSNDGEMFVSAARSLVRHQGFRFDGLPVNEAPPAWAMVLAAGMKISPSFAFLKLINPLLLTLALALSYWIIRRFTRSPWTASGIIVLTALMSHIDVLAMWFHSDACFCAVSAGMILLALQLGEGARSSWRLPLLLALCVVCVCIRWAGVLNWLLVAGALLAGDSRSPRAWVLAIVAGIVIGGTLLVVKHVMKPTPAELLAIKQSGVFLDDSAKSETQQYDLSGTLATQGGARELARRFAGGGRWFSQLFWQPFRLFNASNPEGNVVVRRKPPLAMRVGDYAGLAIGWFAVVCFITQVIGAQRGNWFWAGNAAFFLVLFAIWPKATPRYLAPIVPMLLLGTLLGLAKLLASREAPSGVIASPGEPDFFATSPPAGVLARALIAIFVASYLVVNVAMYAVEVYIEHQPHFYDAYEAGMNHGLIDIAKYLRDHEVANGVTVLNPKYNNLGRARAPRFGLRALVMLTDKQIALLPTDLRADNHLPPQPDLMKFAHEHHLQYYVCEPPISPWREWHFRLAWYQKAATHQPVVESPSTWELWDVSGDLPVRVDVPRAENWPTWVPGL